jgi:hypothetical protein
MAKHAHRQAGSYRGSPRHEPAPEMERILMMDFTSTQAQAKEVAPPLLTADGVDKMYSHLAEIHAIATTQLVE